jgi:hypothetical protein
MLQSFTTRMITEFAWSSCVHRRQGRAPKSLLKHIMNRQVGWQPALQRLVAPGHHHMAVDSAAAVRCLPFSEAVSLDDALCHSLQQRPVMWSMPGKLFGKIEPCNCMTLKLVLVQVSCRLQGRTTSPPCGTTATAATGRTSWWSMAAPPQQACWETCGRMMWTPTGRRFPYHGCCIQEMAACEVIKSSIAAASHSWCCEHSRLGSD